MPVLSVRATIPILTADEVSSSAAAALREARQRLDAIQRGNVPAVLDAWDETAVILEDAYGPISLLNSVHPEAAVRDASRLRAASRAGSRCS